MSSMNTRFVRNMLRAECEALGGERVFAEKAGCSVQLVNAVLHGVREPRGRLLDTLGLEKFVGYRRKKSE